MDSFNFVKTKLESIRKVNPSTIVILVGNKIELKRVISYEQVIKFKEENNISHYIETSVVQNLNINHLFKTIAIMIYRLKLHEHKEKKHNQDKPKELNLDDKIENKQEIRQEVPVIAPKENTNTNIIAFAFFFISILLSLYFFE